MITKDILVDGSEYKLTLTDQVLNQVDNLKALYATAAEDPESFEQVSSEISAAFALVQLNNLEKSIQSRQENFQFLESQISSSINFKTFKSYKNVSTGWLAFPMLLTNK